MHPTIIKKTKQALYRILYGKNEKCQKIINLASPSPHLALLHSNICTTAHLTQTLQPTPDNLFPITSRYDSSNRLTTFVDGV